MACATPRLPVLARPRLQLVAELPSSASSLLTQPSPACRATVPACCPYTQAAYLPCCWLGSAKGHYYKKGISHGLKTYVERFSWGPNYCLRNYLCGKYLAWETFYDGYPSRKVGYRDDLSQNSHGIPLFERVFTVTLVKNSVHFLNYMLIFTIFSRGFKSRDFNYEKPIINHCIIKSKIQFHNEINHKII